MDSKHGFRSSSCTLTESPKTYFREAIRQYSGDPTHELRVCRISAAVHGLELFAIIAATAC